MPADDCVDHELSRTYREAYAQHIEPRRCANCGNTEESDGRIIRTTVIDWRTDELCDPCVASYDWSDWSYVASTRTYTHK
jgi:hypothetical protein